MIRQEEHNTPYLQFENLSAIPNLHHALLLRQTPVSPLIHQTTDALGLPNLHQAEQTHGINSREITPSSPQITPDTDALMTDHPNLSLMIKHADCQAAILYDPVHHAVANVHAGWRGSVQNIYAHTITQMQKRYKTDPELLLVGIGPSLGPNAAEFKNYRNELPESFWKYQVSPYYFDFWAISEAQLMACGVKKEHIEIARLCTYSDPDNFFSFRRNNNCGRLGTVVCLKN